MVWEGANLSMYTKYVCDMWLFNRLGGDHGISETKRSVIGKSICVEVNNYMCVCVFICVEVRVGVPIWV